ncbi:two-component regulator propeller domain-containing protein [Chryseolinea sp. H1M3-3]|uniref:two-component regulator propeller domain-containing protein n=1 Tax=Chryseolinea sp. H1M3-3 TaxID=3034144 RepID=UPI0023ED4BBA|nr:two-component regulator propeller domain-containing protein [Chryseolinea sp. H1M3-3]
MSKLMPRALILWGFFLLVAGVSFCQDIKFNHITTDDGLANGNVRTILQDYQGFFWIGTEDGLQRYDGYSLVEYRHDRNDSTSISSNFIFCLYEDSKKNLWVGTMDGGICWYNRKENNFYRFKNNSRDPASLLNNLVRSITESSDGRLYIGLKEGGFSHFKIPETITEKIAFTNFPIQIVQDAPGPRWVSDIIEDHDKSMLVAIIGGGVHRYNPKTNEFHEILKDSITKRTQRLTLDSKNRLWISTWGDGLYVYDHLTKRLAHHTAGLKEYQLDHNQIEDVHEDAEGNFWICTDNGLSFLHYSFDPFDYCYFVNYTHNEFEPSSLLSNSIKAFYRDKMNRLWIGSYFGGVNIYDKNAFKFNPVRYKVWAPGSISSNNVSSFEEDEQGSLWIATDGGGLNFLKGGVADIRKDAFEKIDIRINGQRIEKIKCLELDKEGNLWIGTWGSGLVKFNTSTRTSQHYGVDRNSSSGLLADQVMMVKADNQDNLWIGTFSGGLSYFDKKQNKFTHYPNLYNNTPSAERFNIKSIFVDSKGRVWIAPEVRGLHLYDSATRTFRAIKNSVLTQDLTILSILEAKDGTLWLGTNGAGLIHYNPEKKTTELYNEKMGLANNVIYAIEQDSRTGKLWLSSNKGLSEFDYIKKTSKNYNRTDGLQGNQYNPESSFRSAGGTLLFGGINGMDAFEPGKIETSSHLPQVVFTNFFLDNVEVNVNESGSPLKENIILAKNIDLNHNQNSFSVGFAILEYSFSDRNQYAYMLEGFNDTWQQIGSERKATFTNLNPGSYTLKVKASNSDGVWMTAEKKLVIHIHPAWWQTTFFKVGIILLFTLTAIAVVRIRINYLLKQKQKLKKKVKERTYELKLKNDELTEKIEEIRSQNEVLHKQKIQIVEKNNEIQAQNEELTAQNDQIILQRENLREAEQKLKEVNEQLEAIVEQRTKKLEETIIQLDKTVTELDRFVYSASHDLSAPLKSVLGLVQIARMEKEPERLWEYYNHIEFSIQKLDRVIKSMVEFSRNYHLDVQAIDFSFHELVDEVLRELAFWPEARRISFKNNVAVKESIIKSDSQRMKVVLHNLISNSVKYADLTKPDSYIHIDLHKNGAYNTITISDNGMGIEKERQSRIFEMYYRATDRSHGSGLGLFIVKEIILKLGGFIEVKSVYGTGSSFIIHLPKEPNGRNPVKDHQP